MDHSLYFVCRVLATKPERIDFVVFEEAELGRRHDVEVVSKGFTSAAAAAAIIKQLGGTIPYGHPLFLDNFEGEYGETVWCWKDERTLGSSQIFSSEEGAVTAMNSDELIFDALLD